MKTVHKACTTRAPPKRLFLLGKFGKRSVRWGLFRSNYADQGFGDRVRFAEEVGDSQPCESIDASCHHLSRALAHFFAEGRGEFGGFYLRKLMRKSGGFGLLLFQERGELLAFGLKIGEAGFKALDVALLHDEGEAVGEVLDKLERFRELVCACLVLPFAQRSLDLIGQRQDDFAVQGEPWR